MAIFRPDIEAATDSAVGTDGFGSPDTRLAHMRFHLGDLQNGAIAYFGLDALDDIDHAFEGGLGQGGHVARLSQHRLLHQRIAGADGDTVPA